MWFGTITAIVLIVFSFTFYYFLKQSVQLKLQTTLYTQAEEIEADILSSGALGKNLLKKEAYRNLDIAVIKEGKVILENHKFTLNYASYYPIRKDRFFLIESEQYLKGIYVLILQKPFNGKVIVATHKIDNTIEDVEDTLLTVMPLLLLILLFLGSKLIDKILIPVEHITQTANAISVNNFSGTIPVPEKEDEIKALVEAFNRMIVRLKEGVENLNRFNSDVSHELRTPLTVIKGEIEVTLRKLRKPEAYIKSMHTIAYEAEQIEQIVENLLLLTRYSKESIVQTFEPCQLDTMLLAILSKYNSMIHAKQLNLHIAVLEPVLVHGNPLLLAAIFSNLVDNAVKYTTKGKKITISLYRKEKIHFMIEDEGIGIPKEKLTKVTDRFYRVDVSRNRHIQGFGLGLSIVKKGIELHRGKMEILSTLGKGTTVHLLFP